MDEFTKLLRAETTAHFSKFQENIPNFDPEVMPVFDKIDKIEILLAEIAQVQKQYDEKCDDSCLNCSPDLLGALVGMPIQKKVEEKAVEETPTTNQAQESSAANSNEKPSIQEPVKEKEKNLRIVPQISEAEFSTIPKYQLGRLTLENLNEIVGKMDEFLMKKNQILTKTNKQLTRNDRELLDNWRELEMKSKKRLPTTLFFIESDIRPLLQDRLRPTFAKAIPCLRHIRRVREERCGPLTFYYP